MMGPDGLKLLEAFPLVVLYAIGEFALFLVPVLLGLGILTALLRRFRLHYSERVPGPTTFFVLAILAAVPGGIYWLHAPASTPSTDPFRSYRSTTTPDASVKPLAPPAAKDWPSETGYLDLPRTTQPGVGVVRVRGGMYDVYVKLCGVGSSNCADMRHAFLKRGTEFSFAGLPPGDYEVRYLPIRRPTVGGRSRPIRVSEYVADDHVVRIDDSPVFESPRNPIVAIYPRDF